MGILKKGVTGPLSGRVDNLVGSNYRGKNVLRGRPRKSGKPPKPGQVQQRKRVSFASVFLAQFKPAIEVGFKRSKNSLSASEAAIGELLVNNLKTQDGQLVVDFSRLKLSNGRHYGARSMQAMAGPESMIINFSWNVADLNESEQVAFAYDSLTIAMYTAQEKHVLNYVNITYRKEGMYNAKIPLAYTGKTFHVFVFFTTEDNKKSSATQYLGTVVPQD